jgi:hypothetical protein
MLYEGNSKACSLGNSFFNKLNASPSLAITGSKLLEINAFIIGIHRVACPNPQFNGATKIRFLGRVCFSVFILKIRSKQI